MPVSCQGTFFALKGAIVFVESEHPLRALWSCAVSMPSCEPHSDMCFAEPQGELRKCAHCEINSRFLLPQARLCCGRCSALKTKHETPKYGLIYHASLIGQSAPKFKGKISRVLAAKCSLAIRVDALGDSADAGIGLDARAKVKGLRLACELIL
jgi:hypothetical protein